MAKYNIKNLILISSLIAAANLCMPVSANNAALPDKNYNTLKSIRLSKSSNNLVEIKLITQKKLGI